MGGPPNRLLVCGSGELEEPTPAPPPVTEERRNRWQYTRLGAENN